MLTFLATTYLAIAILLIFCMHIIKMPFTNEIKNEIIYHRNNIFVHVKNFRK